MSAGTTSLLVAKPNRFRKAPNGTPPIPAKGADVLGVKMFNVGEGEAILVTFPSSKAWFVDSGCGNGDKKNRMLGENLALYLKENKLKLEALVASHPHKDHAGAFYYLLGENPKLGPKLRYYYTWDPPSRPKKEWLIALEDKVKQLGSKAEKIDMTNRHREIKVGNAELHLFAGKGEAAYTSIFMHLHFGDSSFFFSGDAHCTYENELLDHYGGEDFGSNILKVTHHGSSSGTGNRFLAAVKPAIAIASTSVDPDHRLEKDVKKRLLPSKVLQTLTSGDITIRTEGRSLPEGVVYQVETTFPGEFAQALSVPDSSQMKQAPPQQSPTACL